MPVFLNRHSFHSTGGQLRDHIRRQMRACLKRGEEERDRLMSPESVISWQQAFRKTLADSLGGLPLPESRVRYGERGEVKYAGFSVRKLVYRSSPGVPVTALLWVPEGMVRPRPGILFLPGHEEEGKNSPMYLSVCSELAHAGFVVLSIDPIGQGERLSYWDPSMEESTVRWGICEHEYAGRQALLTGRPLGYYFLRDAVRGLDLLQQLPEVDGAKLGVTGNSGGGLLTSVLSALDHRVTVCCPGTFITNLECMEKSGQAQDAEQLWPGFAGEGHDHESLMAAVAPRPFLVLASQWDTFPIEGTMRTFERAKRIWSVFQAEESVELYIDAAPHAYTASHANKAVTFFQKHLRGKVHESSGHVCASPLRVTDSGQVLAEFAGAVTVFEENMRRYRSLNKRCGEVVSLGQKDAWLRRMVGEVGGVRHHIRMTGEGESLGAKWRQFLWYSHEAFFSQGVLWEAPAAQSDKLCIALWEGGADRLGQVLQAYPDLKEQYRYLFIMDLNGHGVMAPDPVNARMPGGFYGTIHKYCDDLVRLGDCLAALNAREILSVFIALKDFGIRWPKVDYFLLGAYAMPGLCAACLSEGIDRVQVDRELHGFRFGNFVSKRFYPFDRMKTISIPGILEHMDLGDFCELLTRRGAMLSRLD